ncbi:hypothetical protein [Palleronia pelagia]|uniref:hypothetical protein n=1 Tax=Palleronia pelagia TaxID=387096 RepID=UPI0011144B4C|nr:hypothetical protein [Palleronia pelagia]
MKDEGIPRIEAGSGIDPVGRYPGEAHNHEEIVAKLRQVDVLVSQGQSVAEARLVVNRFTSPH